MLIIDSHTVGDNTTMVIGATSVGNSALIGFGTIAGYEGNNTLVIDGVTKQVVIGANLNMGNAQHQTISKLYCRSGNLRISTGNYTNHRDSIRLTDVICAGDISIQTSDGSDTVELHGVNANSLLLMTSQFRSTAFDDHDRVTLTESRFAGEVTVLTGYSSDGWDVVEIFNLGAPRLFIETGGGFDQVSVRQSYMDELFADLGAGIDSMTLENTSISGRATIDGGDSLDSFYDRGGNRVGTLNVRNFEWPLPLPWPL
jgi:hypothetical protein